VRKIYLREHGVMLNTDGSTELALPLDKLQHFLDLLGPAEVSPNALQKLYRSQSELVTSIETQLRQAGLQDPKSSKSVDGT
jgi:hypothetical protein